MPRRAGYVRIASEEIISGAATDSPFQARSEIGTLSAATARRSWRSWKLWTSCWPRPAPAAAKRSVARHHQRGKLLVRERIELLVDRDSPFLELSPLAAAGTEYEVGASTAAGIGVVSGVECYISGNDPTVRGGAVNPYTMRKRMRGFDICLQNRLPHISLTEVGRRRPAAAVRDLSARRRVVSPPDAAVGRGHSHDLAGVRQFDGRRRLHAGHVRLHRVRQRARQGVSGRAAAGEDGHRRRIERRGAGRRGNALQGLGPVRLPGRRRARRAAHRPRDRRQLELEKARARRRPTTSRSRSTMPRICWAWRRPT